MEPPCVGVRLDRLVVFGTRASERVDELEVDSLQEEIIIRSVLAERERQTAKTELTR
jgi:hypothetical protein